MLKRFFLKQKMAILSFGVALILTAANATSAKAMEHHLDGSDGSTNPAQPLSAAQFLNQKKHQLKALMHEQVKEHETDYRTAPELPDEAQFEARFEQIKERFFELEEGLRYPYYSDLAKKWKQLNRLPEEERSIEALAILFRLEYVLERLPQPVQGAIDLARGFFNKVDNDLITLPSKVFFLPPVLAYRYLKKDAPLFKNKKEIYSFVASMFLQGFFILNSANFFVNDSFDTRVLAWICQNGLAFAMHAVLLGIAGSTAVPIHLVSEGIGRQQAKRIQKQMSRWQNQFCAELLTPKKKVRVAVEPKPEEFEEEAIQEQQAQEEAESLSVKKAKLL